MSAGRFEFVGYVESINIKGKDAPSSHQFLFSVVSVSGDQHWPFRLDWNTGPVRYGAMASLLTAAFAADRLVQINIAGPTTDGPPYASEIEVVRSKK